MTFRIALLCALIVAGGTPAGGSAQQSEREIEGMIDLHAHAAPDAEIRGPRSLNAIEAAQMARRHGMRAILLKNHYTETASQAYLVTQAVPDIEVYGGITLNRTVGGINPAAVENMATITGRLGRVVWLPTFDSENNSPDGDNVPITPLPADGFRWMVARLEEAGLTPAEIDLMTKRNPARFLGLD